MNMFLNFSVNTGISYTTYRDASAISCGDDFQDWALEVSAGERNATVSCDDLEVAIKCLEDDGIWHGSDMKVDTMEELHETPKRIQQEQSYAFEEF